MVIPWDIRKEFGKGRVQIRATIYGVPYDGSVTDFSKQIYRLATCKTEITLSFLH